MLVNFIFNCISKILGILGLKNVSRISALLGIFSFDILRIRRKVILKNLDIAFQNKKTQQEKITIGRKSVINFANTALVLLGARNLLPKMGITLKNDELIANALNSKLGLYALVIHLGNWEVMSYSVSRKYCPIQVVVKSISNRLCCKLDRKHKKVYWI